MQSQNPKRVLVDTNVLLAVNDGLDLFGELETNYPNLEICILEGTMRELDKLAEEGSGREKSAVKLAKALIEREHLKRIQESQRHVDQALLGEAENGAYILTMDRELQKKALDKGIKVLGVAKHRLIREVS